MLRKFTLLSLMLFIALIFTSACGSGGSGNCDFFGYPNTTPETKIITLSKYKFSIDIGSTDKIIVYVNGEDKTKDAKFKTIKEEFKKDTVATVENGLITALKAGTITFQVSYEDAENVNFTVTANDPTLPTLEVAKNEINLELGDDPSDIESIIVTLNGKDVTNEATFTSTDENVATVDENGNINIVGEGETQIIIHLDGANDQVVTIKVTLPELEINKNEVNLQVGEEAENQQKDTDDLTVKLRGEDKIGEATFTSSDESVATVDENGHITAVSEGEAIITVSVDGAKKSEVKVNVYDPDLHKIILQSNSLVSLQVGQTEQITILIKDQDKTAQAKYTIEDSSIVSVSASGLITALKEGTTKIKVHLEDTEADVEITVDVYDPELHTLHYTSSLPTQIVDDKQYMVMYEGETGHIQILVGGKDKTDSGEYSSGNTAILTVDNDNEGEHEKGKIYAIKEGKTTINLHHEEALEGKDVTVNVLVKPMPNVQQNQFTIIQGYSEQIIVLNNGGDDITSRCTFESEDPTIATVDSTGKVTLVGSGSTTVYAIYDDKRVPVTITELKTVQNTATNTNGQSVNVNSEVLSADATEEIIKVLLDTGMISNENDVNNIVQINDSGLTQIIIYIDRPDGTQIAVISNEDGTLRYISTETVQNGQVSINVESSPKNEVGTENTDGTITTVITPGFYNANNELIASWELVTGDKIGGGSLVFNNGTKQTVTRSKNANGTEENIWGWDYARNYNYWDNHTGISQHIAYIANQHATLKNAKKLVIPDGVTTIGSYAFSHANTPLNTVVYPNSFNNISQSPFYDTDYAKIQNYTINSNNQLYDSIDGIIYNENHDICYACPMNKTNVTIPETVTTIVNAFVYNTSLSIGPYDSNANIKLPNSVKKIGGNAFLCMYNLKWIEFPTGLEEFNGAWVIQACTNIQSVYMPSNVKTIVQNYNSHDNYWGSFATHGGRSLKIYCEVQEANKPTAWANYWNYKDGSQSSEKFPTYWNVTREWFRTNCEN